MSSTNFSTLLSSIAERGLSIVGLSRANTGPADVEGMIELCHMLLSARGEASGIALSSELLDQYGRLPEAEKTSFFIALHANFCADPNLATQAATDYLDSPSSENLALLSDATRPLRSELLHRLNQAPDATSHLVRLRADLLDRLPDHPELALVDHDFVSHFTSWFNRGFLELRNLDWNTPAAILEKIIQYEAVHGMADWSELRERIDPEDRMIYGFFHPRLGNEPLIFVEIALMDNMPATIASVLDREMPAEQETCKTAVFYSISNCQAGLRGIPLGSFLIKQVVEDLRQRYPSLKEFVTLSPIPSFRSMLDRAKSGENQPGFGEATFAAAADAEAPSGLEDENHAQKTGQELLNAAQWYLYSAKDADGRPIDPVARFHLGNGARLERVNWRADLSKRGLDIAFGMMANYRYQLDEIERNHEMFANEGKIAASSSIARAAKSYESSARHDISAIVPTNGNDQDINRKKTVV